MRRGFGHRLDLRRRQRSLRSGLTDGHAADNLDAREGDEAERSEAGSGRRAPPRHTTYAAAVLRVSGQEAVAEDGTSVKHMHKELEKIVRGLRGEGEGAECV